ncbi:MAG: glycosyltransferase family 39 protein [bacterium]
MRSSVPTGFRVAIVLLISLIPRLISLGRDLFFVDGPVWHTRTVKFILALREGNLIRTFQAGHPGVTVMWLAGISMAIYITASSLLRGSVSPVGDVKSLIVREFYERFRVFPHLHLAAKLPIALVTSLLPVAIYWFIVELFGWGNERNKHEVEGFAFLASILVALDPFFLAHSRVLQLDALLTCFMATSALAFLLYMRFRRPRDFRLSAILGGLALLTKSAALFLIPFVALVILTARFSRLKGWVEGFRGQIRDFAIWFGVAFGVFFVLFPAMWIAPTGVLGGMLEVLLKTGVSQPHEWGSFFMGRPVDDPGWLFYPAVILFRSTPISLPFFVVGIFYALGRRTFRSREDGAVLWMIVAFIFFYIIQMSISQKKIDRYILPIFPFLDALAALGIVRVLGYLAKRVPIGRLTIFASLGIVLVGAAILIPLHPNYLAYFNPLSGGIGVASEVMTVGGGEGLREAADYLNGKPDAEGLTVASWYYNSFSPFFRGYTVDLRKDEDREKADYVIFYINQVQRNILPDVIEEYRGRSPEHIVRINGLDYAWIYRVPR